MLSTRIANYIRDSITPRLLPSGGTSGQVLSKSSATNYDASWITPSSSGAISYVTAKLSADVQMATSNTWYSGPSVSLTAGTWFVVASLTQLRSATTAETIYAKITNGTTDYASTQSYHASASGTGVTQTLSCVVTLSGSATITAKMATSAGATTSVIKAAMSANSAGNNASNITAIRLV